MIRASTRINLTSGRRPCGRTIIPPSAAKAQEWTRPISMSACKPSRKAVVPLVPAGLIWPGRTTIDRAYGRMIAPSMTTPALPHFQRATTSFLASAVIITFLKRPPFLATRSWNQRLKAEAGW